MRKMIGLNYLFRIKNLLVRNILFQIVDFRSKFLFSKFIVIELNPEFLTQLTKTNLIF